MTTTKRFFCFLSSAETRACSCSTPRLPPVSLPTTPAPDEISVPRPGSFMSAMAPAKVPTDETPWPITAIDLSKPLASDGPIARLSSWKKARVNASGPENHQGLKVTIWTSPV